MSRPTPHSDSRIPAFVTDAAPAGHSAGAGDSAVVLRSVYTSLAEKDCRVIEIDEVFEARIASGAQPVVSMNSYLEVGTVIGTSATLPSMTSYRRFAGTFE